MEHSLNETETKFVRDVYARINDTVEYVSLQPIGENLSRYLDHYANREIALISASRGNLTSLQNHTRSSALKKDIEALKLGYVSGEGHGQETGKEPVKEECFFVVNHFKYGGKVAGFRAKMAELARKYEQDFILVADSPTKDTKHTGPAYLIDPKDGTVVQTFTSFRAGVAPYFTTLRGKDFHFECLERWPVSNFLAGWARCNEIQDMHEWDDKPEVRACDYCHKEYQPRFHADNYCCSYCQREHPYRQKLEQSRRDGI